MNKSEFLDGLRSQLTGQMAEGKILAHVSYYQEYIETQMRNGKSESEVIAELGAPQLIAKTLLDTEVDDGKNIYDGDAYEDRNEYDVTYGDDFSSTHRQESYDDYNRNGYVKKRTYHLDLTTWYGKLIVILIAVAVIAALIFIIGTIIPILVIVFLVLSGISYFKKRK